MGCSNPLLNTSVVDMICTISCLSTRTRWIIAALVMEDETAMAILNPGSRCAFMVILQDTFHRCLPGTHLLCVSHFNPFGITKSLEEASILRNETETWHSFEELVKLFRFSTRHNVHCVAIITQEVIQDINSTLRW